MGCTTLTTRSSGDVWRCHGCPVVDLLRTPCGLADPFRVRRHRCLWGCAPGWLSVRGGTRPASSPGLGGSSRPGMKKPPGVAAPEGQVPKGKNVINTECTTPAPEGATPCPSWCTARHEDGPRPHSGRDLGSTWGALPVRLFQPDDEHARAGVMVAGDLLDEAAAHELGLALVRAAETLRRTRQAAEQEARS